MSQETIEWLNTYTLQSRKVWHTDDKLQQLVGTIYDGPIPVDDVVSRLFSWEPLECEISAKASVLSPDGVELVEIAAPDRKAICRPPRALSESDPGAILCVPKNSYQAHSYAKWLVENVATILDDDLGIYSAGLLRGGAVAWVQVTVPDTIETPEGVTFRPNLIAATSLDKSLATTYKRTVGNTVCDNTMAAALNERGQDYRIRHSRYSDLRIMEARDALALVHTIADDFASQVADLCATTVTDAEYDRFLEQIASTTDKDGLKTGRAATIAKNKQDELRQLWRTDTRVSPWKNTAYGVVQAVNTHAHHLQTVRGASRDERNMSMTVFGDFDRLDASTLETLTAVCA